MPSSQMLPSQQSLVTEQVAPFARHMAGFLKQCVVGGLVRGVSMRQTEPAQQSSSTSQVESEVVPGSRHASFTQYARSFTKPVPGLSLKLWLGRKNAGWLRSLPALGSSLIALTHSML